VRSARNSEKRGEEALLHAKLELLCLASAKSWGIRGLMYIPVPDVASASPVPVEVELAAGLHRSATQSPSGNHFILISSRALNQN
jgi:hypothetical protein